MQHKLIAKLAAATILAISAGTACAEDATFGKVYYDRYCTACHGATGEGDGSVAELFAQKPRNLRTLAADNNKAFPFSEVYQAINGRREIAGHGTSAMPIWGNFFMAQAAPPAITSPEEAEQIVQGRILSLVYYLQTIQD